MTQDPAARRPRARRADGRRRARAGGARAGAHRRGRVDDVIRAVEELEERPIEEHVGVFESAQVQLRRALDDPGDADELAEPGRPPRHA